MAAAGIDPRLIYASRKTGLLVTEENLDKLPVEALEEWSAALGRVRRADGGRPLVRGLARTKCPLHLLV